MNAKELPRPYVRERGAFATYDASWTRDGMPQAERIGVAMRIIGSSGSCTYVAHSLLRAGAEPVAYTRTLVS